MEFSNGDFRPKRVLVTGVAGFIGSSVADILLQRGDIVIGIDDMNDYYDARLKQANIEHLKSAYPSDRFISYKGSICNEGTYGYPTYREI